MSKLAIGTRVRLKSIRGSTAGIIKVHLTIGDLGTIELYQGTTSGHNYPYLVRFDKYNKHTIGTNDFEIGKARIKDTKIARKLNPNCKILGNGWLEV